MDEKMKIIVCIKVVPDISVLDFDLDTRAFDPDDFVYMVNPADLVALEAAINLKKKLGSGEVICLCVAHPSMEKHLRRCLAMGGDRAVLIWDDRLADSDGMATANILAAAVKKIGFDMVLCGDQAMDDEGGIVGPALAGILGVPHISAVTRLLVSDGKATVHRALERGEREVLECSLPALFTVHSTMSVPRYPAFPASLAALEKEVPVWGLAKLELSEEAVGAQGSLTGIVGLSLPRPRPRVTLRMDSGLHPAERMRLLLQGGLGEKKGEVLEGNAKDLARKIIQIIRDKKDHVRDH
jgi:electron transfer flavoprotein beta subunit